VTENQFDRELRRRNMWYAIAALISIVWGVVLLYGALAVHDVPAVSTLTYALFLVVMLSNMGTWLCATARRTDLYTIARGNSVTQLERFRVEIDNAIEMLKAEQKEEKNGHLGRPLKD